MESGPVPSEGTQRKKENSRAAAAVESEQWGPQTEYQHRGDEPLWLVGGSWGLTGGLWETWTLLAKSTHALTCSEGGWGEGTLGLLVAMVLATPCSIPQPALSECSNISHSTSQHHTGSRELQPGISLNCGTRRRPSPSMEPR